MGKEFHIVMFSWLHMGHMIPYLHLANQLAERGHKTTLLIPRKAMAFLSPLNFHPSLISLHPITIPHVEPLPPAAETASDIPIHLATHLATAMDLTRPELESIVEGLRPKPDFFFYDMAYWIPEVASRLGIKSVCYKPVCVACSAIATVPARILPLDRPVTEADLARMPPGYPSSEVVLRGPAEWRKLLYIASEFGSGLTFHERMTRASSACDAVGFRACREIEGSFCDYVSSQYNKPVLLSGPVLPEPTTVPLDAKWAEWLGRFGPDSVVFCSFGSQVVLEKQQFQELLLGFEMTGKPFFVALKPPSGCASVAEALPEGFAERVGQRGVVQGDWVQQPQILSHPSVGCFVSHCGLGAMWESLMSECQIVLVPHMWDHIMNTRIMAAELKVAVEVESDQDNGWVSKESLCKAIKAVTDEGSEVGSSIKRNHAKWREVFAQQGFMSGYIDKFVKDLESLVGCG